MIPRNVGDVIEGDRRYYATALGMGVDLNGAVALDGYKRVSYTEVFRGSKGRKVLEAAPIITDVRVSVHIEDKAVTKRVSG